MQFGRVLTYSFLQFSPLLPRTMLHQQLREMDAQLDFLKTLSGSGYWAYRLALWRRSPRRG